MLQTENASLRANYEGRNEEMESLTQYCLQMQTLIRQVQEEYSESKRQYEGRIKDMEGLIASLNLRIESSEVAASKAK